MSKLSTPNPNQRRNVDDMDDDAEALTSPAVRPTGQRDHAGNIFAKAALEAALNRRTRALLKRDSGVYIVHLPHEAWIKHFQRPVRHLNTKLSVHAVSALEKTGGVMGRAGLDGLEIVQKGFGTVFISQDPDNLLDEAVLAAADTTITVPPPSPALLQKVIRHITKGTARGVTPAMAGLDPDIIVSVIRPDLSARQCVDNLQRAVDRQPGPPVNTVPLLSALPLTTSMRVWTDQTLSELDDVKSEALLPEALVYAALEGPPGTGKSLIAQSLAATAGWNFVSTSVGAWFAGSDGALGGVARQLRGFVDSVLTAEPAIAFLDELDALPNREKLSEHGRDWWSPIITLFLTEIDRMRTSGKRVLLLGATNYYDRLDPALIRSGRLTQRISVLPPASEIEVLAVLRHFLGADLPEADFEKLVRFAVGATPATIEGWNKTARAAARADCRDIVVEDVLAQITPAETRAPEFVRAIAIHEIGHAVVADVLGHGVASVSLVPDATTDGRVHTKPYRGLTTRDYFEVAVTIALAGRAADLLFGDGPHAGAEADLVSATQMLIDLRERYGLRDRLLHGPTLGHRKPIPTDCIEADLQRLLDCAKRILLSNCATLFVLVDRLIAQRVLTGEDIARELNDQRIAIATNLQIEGGTLRHDY